MKSETLTVQQIFQERRQYRVPFYQRAYVWQREEQWEPLWEDIRDKAELRLSDTGEPPPHFLGAIVLEPQRRIGLRGVETFHIIDGQQRLTTLQYFLTALAIGLRRAELGTIVSIVASCLWNANPETMEQPDIEQFKVWPTFRDRENYQRAMRTGSQDELRDAFPHSFTQQGTLRRIAVEHPPALEAIWFFHERIWEWSTRTDSNGGRNVASLLESLAEAVLRDLKMVSISLTEEDDPQVIFETLNARGAELHATDLIRNFIFMRADREAADTASLYNSLWSPFESSFWIEEQRRGRLKRPRLEWFVQTALQAQLAEEIDVGRLYANYRRFAIGGRTPVTAEVQLRTLNRYAEKYRQLISGNGDDPIAHFGRRMGNWDASPTHALALRVASSGLASTDQTQIYADLVSYIVRRAICGLTIKNYNKVFLQLLKRLAGC